MDEQSVKPQLKLIFFYGKGGSGKDTQGKQMITENPSWVGISTGDEIKTALKNPESRHHRKVKPFLHYIEEGKYLPDSTVIDLKNPRNAIYSEFVEDQISAGAEVIISTGFPRTLSQLDLVDEYILRLQDQFDVSSAHIYLDVADDTARFRAAKRMAEDIASGKEPRKDDKPETVEKRLKEFNELTFPIMGRLEAEGRLIVISAEGTPEQVNELIKAELYPRPLEIREPDEIRIRGIERG